MGPQKYRSIAEDLRDQILNGRLKPGDRLPTHEALMAKWHTTGMTIRRALGELTAEGLIDTRPTVGTFVRNRARVVYQVEGSGFPPMFPGMDDGLLALLAGPGEGITQTISVDVVVPPREVAERLLLGNRPALLRHRVRSVGGRPVNIADGYYPYDLVEASAELTAPAVIERGVADILAEMGLREVRRRVEIYSGMPTPKEAEQLHLGPGRTVQRQMYTTRAAADIPVHCSVSILPGDICILVCDQELSGEQMPKRAYERGGVCNARRNYSSRETHD